MNLTDFAGNLPTKTWQSDFQPTSHSYLNHTAQLTSAKNYDIVQRMAQINLLLQSNFCMISDLDKRINNLIELNEKIAQQLEYSVDIPVKRTKMIEQRPPEERIIERIFGRNEHKYCLLIKGTFKPLLYKDRNFNIFIGLFDMSRSLVVNCKKLYNLANSIPLKISAYSSTQYPEVIDVNKQNQPIFKGNTSADLTLGHASFQKISFREVSSKFDRGVVHIIISVEAPPFEKSNVDYRHIRPLLLKDVMIRAKRQI